MGTVLTTLPLEPGPRKALERAAGPRSVVSLEGLTPVLPDVEVILCAGLGGLPPGALEAMESLRLVQTVLAGADHLPLRLFQSGVAVCTTAGAGSVHVAEHAFALLLEAAKNVGRHTQALRAGRFDRSPKNRVLYGTALGILGLGHVGRAVARMGRAFGMRILAINRRGTTEVEVDFIGGPQDLLHVLGQAHFLVVTLPLTGETEGLLGQEELQAMRPDAVLVNVGRGAIVQEEALYDHLQAHPEFRAAFDVWWTYPEGGQGRPFTRPFHTLENFRMTPHVAGHVEGHREALLDAAIQNIANYFMDRPLMNRVKPGGFPPETT